MAVKAIPDGYHSVTPYLTVQGVPTLIDFMKQAFEAQEIERMTGPDGRIGHAEVKIGDSIVMMGEAGGQWQPMPGSIYLYVNARCKQAQFQRWNPWINSTATAVPA
jgi:PhnB protein